MRGEAELRAGEDIGEVGQRVFRPELQEQIEDLVDDLVGAGVGAIDLVDHDHRPQAAFQGLRKDEAGLRHRPLGGVDQHQRAVGHAEDALDFAAEIGVAGRVDDVDLHAAVGDGDVLREDGDSPLAFEVVGVEDLLAGQLRLAEPPALAQHAIDQRRLAVVDVGDDGDVANVLAANGVAHYGTIANCRFKVPLSLRERVGVRESTLISKFCIFFIACCPGPPGGRRGLLAHPSRPLAGVQHYAVGRTSQRGQSHFRRDPAWRCARIGTAPWERVRPKQFSLCDSRGGVNAGGRKRSAPRRWRRSPNRCGARPPPPDCRRWRRCRRSFRRAATWRGTRRARPRTGRSARSRRDWRFAGRPAPRGGVGQEGEVGSVEILRWAQDAVVEIADAVAVASAHLLAKPSGLLRVGRLKLGERGDGRRAGVGQGGIGATHPPRLGEKSVVQEGWGINPRRRQFPLRRDAGEVVVIGAAVSGQGHAQLAEVVAARGQTGVEAAALNGRQSQRRGDEKHRRGDRRVEPAGTAAPTRRDPLRADRRPARHAPRRRPALRKDQRARPLRQSRRRLIILRGGGLEPRKTPRRARNSSRYAPSDSSRASTCSISASSNAPSR